MDAVNRGDMETAQKMVDEAAKKAGYATKGYHGSRTPGFTVVDKYSWLWLARNESVANEYGVRTDVDNEGKPYNKKVYAKQEELIHELRRMVQNGRKTKGVPACSRGLRTFYGNAVRGGDGNRNRGIKNANDGENLGSRG